MSDLFNEYADDKEVRIYWIGTESSFNFKIEDLYQAFKERLMEELRVASPDLREMAVLVEGNEHED